MPGLYLKDQKRTVSFKYMRAGEKKGKSKKEEELRMRGENSGT